MIQQNILQSQPKRANLIRHGGVTLTTLWLGFTLAGCAGHSSQANNADLDTDVVQSGIEVALPEILTSPPIGN